MVDTNSEYTGPFTIVRLTKGAVVASFQGAKSPSVWRVKQSALEEAGFKIVENKGSYDLLFMRSNVEGGEVISQFDTKPAANEAMSALTSVLMQLDGGEVPMDTAAVVTTRTPKEMENDVAMSSVGEDRPSLHKWHLVYWVAFAVIAVLTFLVIFMATQGNKDIVTNATGDQQYYLPEQPNTDTMGGTIDDLPEVMEGRPLSADDYFNTTQDGE